MKKESKKRKIKWSNGGRRLEVTKCEWLQIPQAQRGYFKGQGYFKWLHCISGLRKSTVKLFLDWEGYCWPEKYNNYSNTQIQSNTLCSKLRLRKNPWIIVVLFQRVNIDNNNKKNWNKKKYDLKQGVLVRRSLGLVLHQWSSQTAQQLCSFYHISTVCVRAGLIEFQLNIWLYERSGRS